MAIKFTKILNEAESIDIIKASDKNGLGIEFELSDSDMKYLDGQHNKLDKVNIQSINIYADGGTYEKLDIEKVGNFYKISSDEEMQFEHAGKETPELTGSEDFDGDYHKIHLVMNYCPIIVKREDLISEEPVGDGDEVHTKVFYIPVKFKYDFNSDSQFYFENVLKNIV